MKKIRISLLCLIMLVSPFINLAFASGSVRDIVDLGTVEQSKSDRLVNQFTNSDIQEPVWTWCSAGTILTTTCPDGTVWNTGIATITYNCETLEVYRADVTDYSGLFDCEEHDFFVW